MSHGNPHNCLCQWFSKCSPQTNSISITWELVLNAYSWTPTSDLLNWKQYFIDKLYRWVWCMPTLRPIDLHCKLIKLTMPVKLLMPFVSYQSFQVFLGYNKFENTLTLINVKWVLFLETLYLLFPFMPMATLPGQVLKPYTWVITMAS